MKAKQERYVYFPKDQTVRLVSEGEEIPKGAQPWPTQEMLLAELRKERDKRLLACDWTEWSTRLSKKQKAAWATYREALRDLPKSTKNPANVDWPAPPSVATTGEQP